MTAKVSWSSPAAFHIFPESRIIGGIDASMMMSLGTCRLVIPRSESTIASAGPDASAALMSASMGARPSSGRVGDTREHVGEAVVRVHADALERRAVLREHVGEVRGHRMAEDDRVGDLHHRGLEVHREQHVFRLGVGHLLGEERVERRDVHERGVDDLAREHRDRLLEHRDRAVARHELHPEVVVAVEGDGLLVRLEIVVPHGGHMGLGIG